MSEASTVTERLAAGLRLGSSRLENRLAAGSFASFVSLLVGIGTAILQVPLLLGAWGEQPYGAWLLVTATYSLIISLDIGHQNYVANKISMIGLNDVVQCRPVLGSAVKAACLIGIAEVGVAIAVAWSGLFWIWLPGGDPINNAIRAQSGIVLILLTTFFAFIGSVGGIVVRLYIAGGLYARSQWIGIAQRVAMLVALVSAAALGCSMGAAALAYVSAGSLVSAYTLYDLRRSFPAYWPWWKTGSLITGLRQLTASLGLTATSVVDQVAVVGLLGISGARVHVEGVATLGTLRTLANAILQAAGVVVLPVVPDLSRFAAAGDHKKAAATLSVLWLIGTTPLCLAITCFQPLAGHLFQWWTRDAITFSRALFALLVLAAILRQWQMPITLFLFSANRVRPQFVISAVRTFSMLAALGVGFSVSSELLTAGIAALISEVCGAAVATGYCRIFFRELSGDFPSIAAGLALLQICVTTGAVLAFSTNMLPVAITILLAVTLQAILAGIQWAALPAEVKVRLTSLCSGSRHAK